MPLGGALVAGLTRAKVMAFSFVCRLEEILLRLFDYVHEQLEKNFAAFL